MLGTMLRMTDARTPLRPSTARPTTTRAARALRSLAIGAAVLALAGCTSAPAPSGDASSPVPSSSTTAAPAGPTASTTPSAGGAAGGSPTASAPATGAAVRTCAPEAVDVALAGRDAGAGNIDWTVRLTNRGARPCTVSGAPTARLLTPADEQLGAPATGSGTAGPTVRLEPGAAATTVVRIVNVGEDGGLLAGRCTPQRAVALAVDSDVIGRYDRLDGAFRGCAETGVPYMTVSPFRAA